jgi:hypothetical protein
MTDTATTTSSLRANFMVPPGLVGSYPSPWFFTTVLHGGL